jgi:hypothetical protein
MNGRQNTQHAALTVSKVSRAMKKRIHLMSVQREVTVRALVVNLVVEGMIAMGEQVSPSEKEEMLKLY